MPTLLQPLMVRIISNDNNLLRFYNSLNSSSDNTATDIMEMDVTLDDKTVAVHFLAEKKSNPAKWSKAHIELYLLDSPDMSLSNLKAYWLDSRVPRIVVFNTHEFTSLELQKLYLFRVEKIIGHTDSLKILFIDFNQQGSFASLVKALGEEAHKIKARQKTKAILSYRYLFKKLTHQLPPLEKKAPAFRISQRCLNEEHNIASDIYKLPPEILSNIIEIACVKNPKTLKNSALVSKYFNFSVSWLNKKYDASHAIRQLLTKLIINHNAYTNEQKAQVREEIINIKLKSTLENSPLQTTPSTENLNIPHSDSEPHWQDMDLSYLDLSKIVADETIIKNVSFKGANLTDASFINTTFINCNFEDATLTNARFTGCHLFGNIFSIPMLNALK